MIELKKSATLVAVIVAAVFLGRNWIQSAPLQTGAPPATPLSFRVIFGALQERAADYSGSVSLSSGKVTKVAPWRFFGGDAMAAAGKWKLTTKRTGMEIQPDQPRPLSTAGQIPLLVPAGVTVTADAPATATAHIATAQGNFDFRLRDLQGAHVLSFRDGDVTVQQTPTPQSVSASTEGQNDYPSLAVTRNGAVWVAWQSYKDLGDTVYVSHSTLNGWAQPVRLNDNKADIFHTAVGEDA